MRYITTSCFSLVIAFVLSNSVAAITSQRAAEKLVCRVDTDNGEAQNIRRSPNGQLWGTVPNGTVFVIKKVMYDSKGRKWYDFFAEYIDSDGKEHNHGGFIYAKESYCVRQN